jgi:D-aspartate ligase
MVLNMDSNGLGVARSLGREGIQVTGVDFKHDAPGLKSRYCRCLVTPHPHEQPERLLEILMGEGRKLRQKGILYPTSDAYVLFVSRFRKELSQSFLFAIPPEDVLEGIINKRRQYELAERIGIQYPRTFYPESLGDVEAIKQTIKYPAFIKPYYSHVWQATFKNKGFQVASPEQLVERYMEVFGRKLQAMAQEIIKGPNTNHVKVCAYLSENHEPFAMFVTKKIRQYPTDFGVGTCMESLHNQPLADMALRFFRGTSYRGTGSIEFKKDECDGEFKMIELNARLWQQNIQATYAGVNFPLIQYLDLTGQLDHPVLDYRDGVRWFDAIQDFQAFWTYRKQGALSLRQWTRSWWGSDCYAYFAWDDPKPAWKNSAYGTKYLKLPLYLLRTKP